MAEFKARETSKVPPPPARLTNNAEVDLLSFQQWMSEFYLTTVLETGLLDPTYQASGGDDIDVDNLPDPVATTIARAQATANLGVELASRLVTMGRVTIEETEDTGSVTFDDELDDDDYYVLMVSSDYTGSPSVDGYRIIKQTRATTGFAFEVTAAPGAGTSITFDYFVMKL